MASRGTNLGMTDLERLTIRKAASGGPPEEQRKALNTHGRHRPRDGAVRVPHKILVLAFLAVTGIR